MLCSTIIWQPLPCLTLVKTQISSCPSNIFLRFSSTRQLPLSFTIIQILFCLLTPQTLCEDYFNPSLHGTPFPKISLFSPVVQHTKIKKSTKGSFLVSTIAHTIYLTTTCVVVALIAPQVYLACKDKKLKTLVAALTLQRIPSIQALSAFEIPGNKEAKFICQDPWVSITITIITVVTIIVYLYKVCRKMTFFRGYLLDSTCTVYIFLSHDCHHVPIKLRGASGPFHTFALTGQLRDHNVELIKHTLWDTLNIKWINTTLNTNGKRIDLPESINIPLWDKVKVRTLMAHTNVKFNLMVKQDNTWYAPRTETKGIESLKSQEEVWSNGLRGTLAK